MDEVSWILVGVLVGGVPAMFFAGVWRQRANFWCDAYMGAVRRHRETLDDWRKGNRDLLGAVGIDYRAVEREAERKVKEAN